MNTTLNYLLESNLGLCLFLLVYLTFLKSETDFKVKRVFILISICASVIFPLLHLNTNTQVIPSLGNFVPPTWLPEIIVTADGSTGSDETRLHFDTWFIINTLYATGVIVTLILFLIRLGKLLATFYKATSFALGQFQIIESTENKSSFSFFHFIFIGQADQLTAEEKQQIMAHENVHVQQLHSVDMLLINIMGIFFWFNPIITQYKKILVQLHEFEADARAVENRDVNNYCSLLAKVALLSADFRLANHFSNSLTVKRIEMMRTIKSKIRGWKIAAILLILPAFFFVVSCQDQVMSDAQEIAKNSSMAIDLPDEVQQQLDDLKKANPTKKFVVLEVDENDSEKASTMKAKLAEINPEDISSINVLKDKIDSKGNKRSFIIIEYNEMTEKLADGSKQDGDIFTVVEESASPVGGIESLGNFISNNLKYPEQSRMAGKEGTVFVQFVVNTDGSLSDFTTIKGVDPLMDEEALRVARLSPNWNPGKQHGKAVRQRFVLPIRFNLDDNVSSASSNSIQLHEVTNNFQITYTVVEEGGKKIVTGKVNDETGAPIRGANIVNVGSTSGTITDEKGSFSIVVSKTNGQLAVSFIGYKMGTIAY